MFKSYMFIPANKKRFVNKSIELGKLNHRIFDLEDSVAEKDIETGLNNLESIEIYKSDWIRIPRDRIGKTDLINRIDELGINNYMIPKYGGYEDFKGIFNYIKSINNQAKFILLLENSKSYLDLEKTLDDFSSSIYGVSLGIHDFTFETGMKNDFKLLKNIRIDIMLIAKTYSVKPLDIVSMYLKDKKRLEEEILDGFESGYREKLLIHPYQLEVLNNFEFYSYEEIKEYEEIFNYFKENVVDEEVIFSFNNKVYEKMHIEEIGKIISWGNKFYGTNR